MKLLKFRIKDFRAIIDTGWIQCDQITAFVGTSESGKTSIMLALIKLMNPDFENNTDSALSNNIGKLAHISLKYDLPVDRAAGFMHGIDKRVFIEAVFSADDALNRRLAELCKANFKPVKEIYISKTYGNTYHMDIYDMFAPEDYDSVTQAVLKKLPALLYYKDVTEIDSEINLVALAEKIAEYKSPELTMCEVIHSNLLSYLDIWKSNVVKSIFQIYGDFSKQEVSDSVDFCEIFKRIPLFKNRFDRGFSNLNQEFKKRWSDEITISYEVYKKGVRIIIYDCDGKPCLLENRSSDFRRFFSLFLSFAISSRQDFENAIMLFDEADAKLHPTTQIKLAEYFVELSQHCQIIYNTHTPNMLPPRWAGVAKTVYKDDTGHICIGTFTESIK